MKKTSIKRWITRCFGIIFILSMALSAAANLHQAYLNTIHTNADLSEACAENVTNLLNHQWGLEELRSDADSAIYQETRKVLRDVCRSYHMEYLYIYSIDHAESDRYYYACVSSDADKDELALQEYSLRTRRADGILKGEQALLDGAKELQIEHLNNYFGSELTWIAPYLDADGELRALIGMDYNTKQFRQSMLTDFLGDIIPFALSLSVGLFFLLFLVQRRVVAPIGALSKSMKLFAQDSSKKPEPLHISPGDEIGEIAASYEKMTEDISAYVNNIEALTRERLEANLQLEIARRIQNGQVPEKKNLEGEGYCISAMTKPAKEVGGDFYDCFRTDEGRICVIMGDVSGNGISAAICMAMLKTAIREKLIAGFSPAEALNQTNDEFYAQNPANLFATAFAAILNPSTGELIYANAGHTYPVLLKEEPALLIPESGIALGMFENAGLTDHTLSFSPGQGILLYTDGVTEAINPQRCFFGTKRLLDAVKGFSETVGSPEDAVLAVSRAVYAFCEKDEVFDDMAVLALLYRGTAARTLPVALSAFDEIKSTVFETAGDTPETRRALLACDETLTNIVSYSGAKTLTFACEKQDGLLRVCFSDDGAAFDPTAAKTEDKLFDLLDSGGMGLNLIRQSVASMQYRREGERNVFTMFFPLP